MNKKKIKKKLPKSVLVLREAPPAPLLALQPPRAAEAQKSPLAPHPASSGSLRKF